MADSEKIESMLKHVFPMPINGTVEKNAQMIDTWEPLIMNNHRYI